MMTFEEWLHEGMKNGYCSAQFCQTHDGGPMTDREYEVWESGDDLCAHMVRLGSSEDWDRDLPVDPKDHKCFVETDAAGHISCLTCRRSMK